jgi:diguanylate cyclase (GGDEF)-like protein
MGFFRRLLWIVSVIVLGAALLALAGNEALVDRLTTWVMAVQLDLPGHLSSGRFLVLFSAVSLLAAILIFAGASVFIARLSLRHQKRLGATAAAALEVAHVKAQHWQQYEELLSLGQLLTKRLDKETIVQTIVEAAGRVTSLSHTPSLVSCWLLNLETETLRFQRGLRSDEACFTQAEYQPTELPFSQVIATQQVSVIPEWRQGLTALRPERLQQAGQATAALIVPLVIEDSVVGILIILCHPEILKRYQEQKPFFESVWGELALALAIAIQGEVAILDRLTGVHNREYFIKRLVQEIERSNRYKQPLSFLMIDIDNFKRVNDTLGHQQGDAVLRIIARLIRKSVRAIDLVARYGGEEFVVMLPETGPGHDPAQPLGAVVVAERIRAAIEEEFQGLQAPLDLTVSIGASIRRVPEDQASDYRDLIRLADEQLYRAKTTGKNKVCSPLPEQRQAISG